MLVQSVRARRAGRRCRGRAAPTEGPVIATMGRRLARGRARCRRGHRGVAAAPARSSAAHGRRCLHGSWTRRARRASTTATTATFEYFVGGGVAAFDCDDDGRADLFFAGGSEPAALYRNQSPVGGALRFDAAGVAGHRPDGGHRRLPARHRQRRARRPRRPAPRGQRRAPRARRLPVRGRERAARPRRRRRLDDGVQRDVGGLERAAHAGVRQLPRARTATACGDSQLVRPAPTGDRYAPPIALTPGYCTLSDAVQRLEPVGPARPAHGERPALLPRRRGAAVADRARRGAPPVHRGRRLAPVADLGHGHRQPGPDRRRLSRGVPHQPGRQQAADARRRPGAADVRGHRAPAWRHRAAAVRRRRRAARRRRGTPSSRTSTTTASSTCSSPRATSRRSPTTRPATRATCCSARPTARSWKGRRPPASSSYDRARGAALVDLNLDGMLDLVVVNRRDERQAVAQRRPGRRRAARSRWATGSRSGSGNRRRTSTRSARGWRCGSGDRTVAREVTVGGGHAGGKIGWLHAGLGEADSAPRSASSGPTARPGRG